MLKISCLADIGVVMAHILLAEDDSSMREFITKALERAGHTVTSCNDGLSALKALENHGDYDLLLTDIVMPGMDGIELSQKAATQKPNIKTMFITGFSGVTIDKKAPETATKVLSKPFHLNDLVAQVNELLAT